MRATLTVNFWARSAFRVSLPCWRLIKFSYEGSREWRGMTERKAPNIVCTAHSYVLPTCCQYRSIPHRLAFSFPPPPPPLIHSIGRTVTIEISMERFRYIRGGFSMPVGSDVRFVSESHISFLSFAMPVIVYVSVTWPHRVSVWYDGPTRLV